MHQGGLEQAIPLPLTAGRLAHDLLLVVGGLGSEMPQLGLERQLTQIGHAHRIKNAVEMIDFVLHHPGMQALRFALDGGAI